MALSDSAVTAATSSPLTDEEIVRRVRAGDRALFEILMRRHNQRVYRVARAVVNDEGEVEDVMQQAYINAFTHLHQFQERARFSTWLTRITLNEAFGRRRRMRAESTISLPSLSDEPAGESMERMTAPQPDPERQAYAGELRQALEAAIDALPEHYRLVFMLRDVEGLSTSEAGAGLGLGDEAVKTRLHRARVMIRRALTARLGPAATGTFAFEAPRCDRVVAAVLARLPHA
jgi:RNA polymerase sigma-70 factor (ECF subfamily)